MTAQPRRDGGLARLTELAKAVASCPVRSRKDPACRCCGIKPHIVADVPVGHAPDCPHVALRDLLNETHS